MALDKIVEAYARKFFAEDALAVRLAISGVGSPDLVYSYARRAFHYAAMVLDQSPDDLRVARGV